MSRLVTERLETRNPGGPGADSLQVQHSAAGVIEDRDAHDDVGCLWGTRACGGSRVRRWMQRRRAVARDRS